MLREQLGAQAEAIRQLTHQLDWFKKQLFGPKSEKQVYDIPEQDSLFQSDEAHFLKSLPRKKSAPSRPINAAPARSSGTTIA